MPILPLLARSYGLVEGQIGMVTGMSPFVRLMCNVPLAKMCETYGRRPFIVVGPIIAATSFFALAASTNFTQLMCANGLLGVGSAMSAVATGLYLADISTPKNRAKTNAPLMMSMMAGFVVGPAIGGILADSFGLHSPFFASALMLSATSAMCFVKIPETLKKARPVAVQPSMVEAWKHILQDRRLLGINVSVLCSNFAQGSGMVVGMLFLLDTLGLSPSTIGAVITARVVSMTLFMKPMSKISDSLKGKRHQLMVPAILGMGIFEVL